MSTAQPAPPGTDGRSLRRDRNRDAVVTAMLDLYRSGDLDPSAEAVARRAGISVRSLFRYFDDVEALVRATIERQQQHLADLYALDVAPGEPLHERLDRFVTARVRLLTAMGEVGRVARNVAARQPLVRAELARVRTVLRSQVGEAFAPELDALPADRRAAVAAVADVLASWEALDLMTADQGLDAGAAADAMRTGLARLLTPGREGGGP